MLMRTKLFNSREETSFQKPNEKFINANLTANTFSDGAKNESIKESVD